MMQGLKMMMLVTVATGVTAKRLQPSETGSVVDSNKVELGFHCSDRAPKTSEKKSSKQAVAQVRQGQSRETARSTKGQSSFLQLHGDDVKKDSNTKSVKQEPSKARGQGNSARDIKTSGDDNKSIPSARWVKCSERNNTFVD